MSFRRFATGAALALAGLAAAVGIGLLANSISGDSVGLGADPLSAGETLAPATAKADDGQRQRQRWRPRTRPRRGRLGLRLRFERLGIRQLRLWLRRLGQDRRRLSLSAARCCDRLAACGT